MGREGNKRSKGSKGEERGRRRKKKKERKRIGRLQNIKENKDTREPRKKCAYVIVMVFAFTCFCDDRTKQNGPLLERQTSDEINGLTL